MKFLQTSTLTLPQKTELIALWNRESPENITHESMADLEKYLTSLEDVVYTLTLDDKEKIVGWFADFDREGERWFAMLLDASIHGKGVGSQLLSRAKDRHEALSGWVIDHTNDKKLNGEPYLSPVNFYLKNGFEIISDVRLELDHLSCVKMRWEKN